MPKRSGFPFLLPLVVILLAGYLGWVACAQNGPMPVMGQYTAASGGSTNIPCPGVYKGYARMTNSSGIWFRPPTNTTSGTFTNTAGFSTPPRLQVIRRTDGATWCGTNVITFPASSSNQYQMGAYLKTNTPPPTNGQVVTLTIIWQ